jgi:hypothetical protein
MDQSSPIVRPRRGPMGFEIVFFCQKYKTVGAFTGPKGK